MAFCLYHPQHGYYQKSARIGKNFTTAPEISQVFGETLAFWALSHFNPMPQVVELGPGRATLMYDFLRTLSHFKQKVPAYLLENSPLLIQQQKEKLANYDTIWIEDINQVPPNPTLFIANEFFDCLPIHQFVEKENRMIERMIIEKDNKLMFSHEGRVTETCPSATAYAEQIADHIQNHGGGALIIDYGYQTPIHSSTLQAIYQGKKCHPLTHSGHADLTAWVDFMEIGNIFQKNKLPRKITAQGDFLRDWGAEERFQSLEKNTKQDLSLDRCRLLDEMKNFHVLSVIADQ